MAGSLSTFLILFIAGSNFPSYWTIVNYNCNVRCSFMIIKARSARSFWRHRCIDVRFITRFLVLYLNVSAIAIKMWTESVTYLLTLWRYFLQTPRCRFIWKTKRYRIYAMTRWVLDNQDCRRFVHCVSIVNLMRWWVI